MIRTFTTTSAVLLLGALLAACGSDGNSSNAGGTTVVIPPAKVEANFGPNFALAYQADPNSEPRAVAPGDIAPVSLSTEPLAVK